MQVYAQGQSEVVMGEAIKVLLWHIVQCNALPSAMARMLCKESCQ